jgi:hypothetical protein
MFGATGVAFSIMVTFFFSIGNSLIEIFFILPQAMAVYTFLSVWVGIQITSMIFTLGIVVIMWSLIAIIVGVGMAVSHIQQLTFVAPAPVSH